MEDVAGETLGVDANEYVLLAFHFAADEGDVVLAGQGLAEGDRRELAVVRGQPNGRGALDETLVAAAVLDELRDGDQAQAVALAELHEVGDAGHRPVVVHDLADDARGRQPREAGEIDGGLRLPDALEHAAGPGPQREDVSRLYQVARLRTRVDRDLDRVRAVGGRDPGGHALARLDRHREGGAERRLVVVRHRAQGELVGALLGQRQADQPACVRGHEVDRLGGRELGGNDEVALVLTVGIVDDDDELALADVFERLLYGREGRQIRLGNGGHRPQS